MSGIFSTPPFDTAIFDHKNGIFDTGIFDRNIFDNILGPIPVAPVEQEDTGAFKQFTPFRPDLKPVTAWLEVAEKPDTLEAFGGAVQFPETVLPAAQPRKRRLPKLKAQARIIEQRDGIAADAQWNLDQVLIDNEMMLLLAA